jgi:hypothetical protein
MTNRILANTASHILRRSGVWKIAFDLNGLTVTGQRYAMVAKAIDEGKIACEAVNQFQTNPGEKLPTDTKIGAQYIAEKNTMYFSREDYGTASAYEQSVVFHEATHALFDLFAKTTNDQTLAIDDESAAVLAQAHFFRLCADNDSVGIHRFSMQYDGPGDTALKLVDKMMAETGDFERDKRTYFLQPDQTLKLRNAVAQDWGFVKKMEPDGERDSTGTKYIYDGVVQCYSCWVHGT